MKIKLLGCLMLLCASLCANYFYNHKEDKLFATKELVDYIHQNGINETFKKADTYKYNQNYLKALAAFEKTLDTPLNSDEKHYALNQLAYINLTINEDSIAHHWIQVLEKDKTPLSILAIADYHYNVGTWAYHTFKPKMSEAYLQKALSGYKGLYGEGHLRVGLCLTQLGMMHYKFALNVDIAQPFILKAYELFSINNSLTQFSAQSNLAKGLLSYSNWDYDAADLFCKKAIEFSNNLKIKDNILIGRALVIRGRCMNRKIKSEQDSLQRISLKLSADNYYKEAEYINNSNKIIWQKEILIEKALNLVRLKDTSKFFSTLRKLDSLNKIQPEYPASIDRLKGFYYLFKNNHLNAKKYYLNFWEIHHIDTLKDRRLISETCNALYECYKTNNKFDSCLYFLKEDLLLDMPKQNSSLEWNKILTTNFYKNIRYPFANFRRVAETFFSDYKTTNNQTSLNQAYSIYKLIDTISYAFLPSSNDDAIIFFKEDAIEASYQNAIDCGYEYYINNKKELSTLNTIFQFMEKTKSFLLYRNMFDKEIKNDSSLQIVTKQIKKLSSELNHFKLQNNSINSDEYLKKTDELNKSYKKLEDSFPDIYKNKQQQQVPPISEFTKLLNPNQAIVQFCQTNNNFYSLVVKNKDIYLIKNKNVELIRANSEKLKEHLTSKNNNNIDEYKKVSYNLYCDLFKEIDRNLNGINELIIVPEQNISQIPLEGLISSLNGNNFKELKYLIYKYSFIITPAIRIYKKNLNKPSSIKPNIVAFTYSAESKELPYSKEVQKIESIYKENSKILRGEECNSANFYKYKDHFNIIQLSLHAFGSTTNRYDNRICFAPKNKDAVYGFDIARHTFNNQLIIISACESGVGKTVSNEGTFSLARYFIQSGSKGVIAAYWKIDDYTSSEILVNFYQNLSSNSFFNKALTNAKIQYIEKCNGTLANPKYWSGLIFID